MQLTGFFCLEFVSFVGLKGKYHLLTFLSQDPPELRDQQVFEK